MPNLIEGLQSETNRVRELKKQYEILPDNAGYFAITLMNAEIAATEKAIASGDTIAMLQHYQSLKGFTG